MAPEAQLALVNILPTLIASLGALVGGLVALKATIAKDALAVAKASAESAKLAAEAAKLAAEVANKEVGLKLDHITTVTNSTLSNALARVEKLENLVREMVSAGMDPAPPAETD